MQQNAGALHGLKVLDFSRAVAGAYCTRLLADMGARVVKIEPPILGDTIRLLGPFNGENWTMPPSISPVFLHSNAGKEGVSLDLKRPEGVDLIKRLVPHFDVVLENFTSHVMPGLGLGYEVLSGLRPDLIMCSITAFGSTGPLADLPGADAVGQAMSGMMSLCGEEDGYPYFTGNGIADTSTGTTAALAILAALLDRARTGAGQHIDISMMHTLFAMDGAAAPYYVASRGTYRIPRSGRFHHLSCPWGVFKGPQGKYLVIMVTGPTAWERLARLMGRADMIEDPDFASHEARLRNRQRVHEVIEVFLAGFDTMDAACQALAAERIVAGPVLDPWEVATHPQTPRDMIPEVPHPFTGPIPAIATAPRFSRSAIRVGRAPLLGEHNRSVFREILGLSESELDRLHAEGVLFEDDTVAHKDIVPWH